MLELPRRIGLSVKWRRLSVEIEMYFTRYSEPATAKQKLIIARLCMALKMREPVEERRMTKGEAGRLIRELQDRIALERAEQVRRKADKFWSRL